MRVPGLNEQVKPEGEADEDKPTVPVNPLTAATPIVEAAVEPAITWTASGLPFTVKSWTVYVTTVL